METVPDPYSGGRLLVQGVLHRFLCQCTEWAVGVALDGVADGGYHVGGSGDQLARHDKSPCKVIYAVVPDLVARRAFRCPTFLALG